MANHGFATPQATHEANRVFHLSCGDRSQTAPLGRRIDAPAQPEGERAKV